MHHKNPILVRNNKVHMQQPIVRGGSLWSKNISRATDVSKRLAAPGFVHMTVGGSVDVFHQYVPKFNIPVPRHAKKRQNIRFG